MPDGMSSVRIRIPAVDWPWQLTEAGRLDGKCNWIRLRGRQWQQGWVPGAAHGVGPLWWTSTWWWSHSEVQYLQQLLWDLRPPRLTMTRQLAPCSCEDGALALGSLLMWRWGLHWLTVWPEGWTRRPRMLTNRRRWLFLLVALTVALSHWNFNFGIMAIRHVRNPGNLQFQLQFPLSRLKASSSRDEIESERQRKSLNLNAGANVTAIVQLELQWYFIQSNHLLWPWGWLNPDWALLSDPVLSSQSQLNLPP